MTELFLTKKQVDELTYPECQTQIKLLNKTYNFNKPLKDCFDQVWPIMDPLVNTQLWLEDRIARFEDSRIPSMDPNTEIAKPTALPRKTGRPARKYRIVDKVYDNVNDAARQTGISVATLKAYVSRHPERYAYVD